MSPMDPERRTQMPHDVTISYVRDAAAVAELELENVKKGKLADALRWWKNLSDQYDKLDAERKRIYAAIETASRVVIPEMMAEEGVKTISLEDIGYRFTVSQRFSCSMPDKEAGMIWLRDNGLADLIQETVNAGTLSSAVKKRIEDEGLEVPPDLFNTNYMSYTSATKVK